MKTHKLKLKLNKQQYKIIKDYCHYSNNLYNYTLYVCKGYYEQANKYIGFKQLYHEVKNNENFKLLPAQVAVQVVKLVDKDYRSFFALLSRKNKGQYTDKVSPPRFKKKWEMFNLIYPKQFIVVNKDSITLCLSNLYKKLNNIKGRQSILSFKFNLSNIEEIKQIIIKPYNNGQYFKMFINYEEVKQNVQNLNKDNYLSIDLGINNLATCFNSVSGHSFIMNGKPLKSYNRYYNKTIAKLRSELKLKNKLNWSKQLQNITENSYNYIDNYFNQVVSKITKYCVSNDIGNIVIGYNETWKTNVNLGKVNNQKFIYIPYFKLKQKLENKCKDYGIIYTQVNESYTSKCSFVDNEPIKKHDTYLGKRVKRGLFKTSTGLLVNADVNGSANILRKVVPDTACSQGIVGLMLNPVKYNYFTKLSN